METRALVAVVAALMAIPAATLLAQLAQDELKRRRFRLAAQLDSQAKGAWIALLLRNGVSALRPLARRVSEIASVRKVVSISIRFVESRGMVSSSEALISLFIAVCSGAFLLMVMLSRSAIGGVLGVILVSVVVVVWAQAWEERQVDALRDAVPEALKAMEACSQTGLSLEQMLQQVSSETPEQLSLLFKKSASVLETGGTASQALQCLRADANVSELAFVSVALDVQHQTGGSLRQVLHAAYDMVEGELELRRHLRVQTAQARLSARVVTVMPFLLAALLTLVSEDFLKPFFSSFTGLAVLAVALLMQLAGVLIVRQMLKVSE